LAGDGGLHRLIMPGSCLASALIRGLRSATRTGASMASAYPMWTVICRGSAVSVAVNPSRCRPRGGVPAPLPGGQRGVKLIDVDADHRHASGVQQARGDRLSGLGERVIIILALVQAVPFRPAQLSHTGSARPPGSSASTRRASRRTRFHDRLASVPGSSSCCGLPRNRQPRWSRWLDRTPARSRPHPLLPHHRTQPRPPPTRRHPRRRPETPGCHRAQHDQLTRYPVTGYARRVGKLHF